MNLEQFLIILQRGAYDVFQLLLRYLTNPELKTLRLTMRSLGEDLFPRMFKRVYFSVHPDDLHTLHKILQHEKARQFVEELVVDDTTFDDRRIFDDTGYRKLLLSKSPQLCLRPDFQTQSRLAFRLWMQLREQFEAYRSACHDILYLRDALMLFNNLKQISILGRQRDSNFDNTPYWQEWQTPRARRWSQMGIYEYLIQPSFHRPISRSVDENSEGLRAFRLLMACMHPEAGFQIRSLRISSLGTHQSVIRGQRCRAGKKLPYVPDLLPYRHDDQSGCLNLLLDAPVFVMSLDGNLWNAMIDICMGRVSNVLEELTLAYIDIESFWSYLDALNRPAAAHRMKGGFLKSCTALRKVKLENCPSARSPYPLFQYLHEHTTVRDIEIYDCSSEAVSWATVLNEIKQAGLTFDRFELKSCSCIMENWAFLGLDPRDDQAAPWNGTSEDVCSWLQNETPTFPLWQGPG